MRPSPPSWCCTPNYSFLCHSFRFIFSLPALYNNYQHNVRDEFSFRNRFCCLPGLLSASVNVLRNSLPDNVSPDYIEYIWIVTVYLFIYLQFRLYWVYLKCYCVFIYLFICSPDYIEYIWNVTVYLFIYLQFRLYWVYLKCYYLFIYSFIYL
jgi:hypothetical protein